MAKGALKELWDSIVYCLESKKGKYSLDTYLDIIGEYADRQIIEEKRKGGSYKGGECTVCLNNETTEMLQFYVEMYFIEPNGEVKKKEAFREVALERFVRETKGRLGNQGMKLQIKEPEGY